jgi:hypothetical protein
MRRLSASLMLRQKFVQRFCCNGAHLLAGGYGIEVQPIAEIWRQIQRLLFPPISIRLRDFSPSGLLDWWKASGLEFWPSKLRAVWNSRILSKTLHHVLWRTFCSGLEFWSARSLNI